ncbi:VOC family protein [Mameliella sediminis]|uniref:VOC family protein n=1 Tax=Mameliella sediminis TaxID=2836866 RepID=UPI001C4656EB|nr:VOC family protein [Mameliella sediminis]MBV7393920.1 VOC family protein [Mameliella sediminis]MBY6115866.1 VOC family protein [Antarctobacter heliothermus]MBY6145356.1 VOC family protein [Mameliella alba]MCA0955104.1 VOC family protein [Mameliella alba]
MDQRVSLITLGCRDMARAEAFYAELGWRKVDSPEGIVVFDLIGQALGLYPLGELARDMGRRTEDLGTGAATLSCNVRNRDEVARILTAAEAAGAHILKPAHDVFWGGHIGYFADPEGHVWEVAHNPFSALGPNGEFRWGGYGDASA